MNERQWKRIPGGYGENIVVRNLLYSEKYRCIVSNGAGSTTSNVSIVTLMGKLSISGGIMCRCVL